MVLLTYDLSNVRLESVMFLIVQEQFFISVFIDFRLLELFTIYNIFGALSRSGVGFGVNLKSILLNVFIM